MTKELIKSEKALASTTEDLANTILKEEDLDNTKQLLNLFNVNIAKKNVLRLLKLNKLQDLAVDEILNRLENDADSIKDENLAKFVMAIQNQVDKSNESIESVREVPTIQLNQDNSVNINIVHELPKESRERVLKAVQSILNTSSDIVDVEVTKKDIV